MDLKDGRGRFPLSAAFFLFTFLAEGRIIGIGRHLGLRQKFRDGLWEPRCGRRGSRFFLAGGRSLKDVVAVERFEDVPGREDLKPRSRRHGCGQRADAFDEDGTDGKIGTQLV